MKRRARDPLFQSKTWKLIHKDISNATSSNELPVLALGVVLTYAIWRMQSSLASGTGLAADFLPSSTDSGVPSAREASPEPMDSDEEEGEDEEESTEETPSLSLPEISKSIVSKAKSFVFSLVRPSNLFSENNPPPVVNLFNEAIPYAAATPLGEGFRKKFIFSGIPGADMLSAKGTYTAAEADFIVRIKSGQVPAGSGMPPEVYSYIVESARKFGVNEELALQVARMESGGNPYAISPNGAIGIYQFTGQTATDFGLDNRFDFRKNIDAGMRLLRARSYAIPSGKESMVASYLTLQLGAEGARKLLSVPYDTPISSLDPTLQAQLYDNYGGKTARTVGEYIRMNQEALDKYSSSRYSTPPAIPSDSSIIIRTPSPGSIPPRSTPPTQVSPPSNPLPTNVVGFRRTVVAVYG